MKRALSSLAVGAVLTSILGACSTTEPTHVTDVWKDPSYAAGPMKNLVVFAARLNETDRRTLEDGFVAALSAHNTRATPSYRVLTTPLPARDVARAKLEQLGFDGALVATLRGVNETVTAAGGPGFWDGYYGRTWGEPYVVEEPVVKFETSLWDLKGPGRLVWSADTRTENPSSGKNFTKSLTSEVVPLLENEGLVGPSTEKPVSYAPPPVSGGPAP
jgi:hypothetical protein